MEELVYSDYPIPVSLELSRKLSVNTVTGIGTTGPGRSMCVRRVNYKHTIYVTVQPGLSTFQELDGSYLVAGYSRVPTW